MPPAWLQIIVGSPLGFWKLLDFIDSSIYHNRGGGEGSRWLVRKFLSNRVKKTLVRYTPLGVCILIHMAQKSCILHILHICMQTHFLKNMENWGACHGSLRQLGHATRILSRRCPQHERFVKKFHAKFWMNGYLISSKNLYIVPFEQISNSTVRSKDKISTLSCTEFVIKVDT